MKFDVIIGKQVEARYDANADAKLEVKYHKLLDRARLFRPRFISWVMRSRWLFGETQDMAEAWRVQFLQSRNFRYLVNYADGKSLFPEIELYGGVGHFLFDTTYGAKQDDLIRVEHFKPYKIEPEVTLLEHLDPYNQGVAVLEHWKREAIACICRKRGDYYVSASFKDLVSTKAFYQTPTTTPLAAHEFKFTTYWDEYEVEEMATAQVRYYVNVKEPIHAQRLQSRSYGYIRRDEVEPTKVATLDLHKVLIPETFGTGIDDLILGEPILALAPSCFAATYVAVGIDSQLPYSEQECEHLCKYLRTKFLRYLVSIKKNTQHCSRAVFTFVPQENLGMDSDIDWSCSIPEIDEQLFAKYEFSDGLRAEIARSVRYHHKSSCVTDNL